MAKVIDADKLKECIQEDGRVTIDESIFECETIHDFLVWMLKRFEAEVIRLIDSQPIAYNVEGVIKELENQRRSYKKLECISIPKPDSSNCPRAEYSNKADAFEQAIEIVKGGAKNEINH